MGDVEGNVLDMLRFSRPAPLRTNISRMRGEDSSKQGSTNVDNPNQVTYAGDDEKQEKQIKSIRRW